MTARPPPLPLRPRWWERLAQHRAWRRAVWTMAVLALLLAVAAVLLGVGAGLGYRMAWWGLGDAFGWLRWSLYGALAALAVSIVATAAAALRPRPALLPALAGLLVAGITAGVPLWHLQQARSVPPIHDITTDLENPPQFQVLLARRAGAPNSPIHGGAAVARMQRRAYPNVRPARFGEPLGAVFRQALETARYLGWRVVDADRPAGRIEATDTTLFFGFTDDVVVRLTPTDGGGTRVDVRSVSRVGVSDAGKNARRVKTFLAALEKRMRHGAS